MSADLMERFQRFVAGDSAALNGVTEQDRFDPASPLIGKLPAEAGIEAIQSRLLPVILGGGPASLRAYELLACYYFAWGEWDLFYQLTGAFLKRMERVLTEPRLDDARFVVWADAAIQIGYTSVGINFQKLNSSREVEIECLDRIYATIARRLMRRAWRGAAPVVEGPLRVAHCVDFALSLGNAITKEVDMIVECTSERQQLYVLSTEINSAAVSMPLALFALRTAPSESLGQAVIRKWTAVGCTVGLFGKPESYCERILAMDRFIREEGIRAVFYHTGVASGMACVLSYLRPAPVQINAHCGLPMFSRAVTATRFWIRGQAERYLRHFGEDHAAFVMPAILSSEARGRPSGRPPAAPVRIATAGNRLPVMMDDTYVGLIVRLLKRFPSARFDAFGMGTFTEVEARFARLGIGSERVQFHGHAHDLTASLAECDVFINTMTRGGGLVPAQAIMAGIPAVNIATVENGYPPDGTRFIDAQYLPADLEAMETFAARLISDPDYRDCVARAQLERLQTVHSPEKTVPMYEQLAERLLTESRPVVEGIEWLT
jgi:glycosyltransferase involved in cell wall biosynthesis